MDKGKREYFIYVRGKAVLVSEEVYKAYWKITEHEKYLQRKDWKHNVIPFSALDHDGHFAKVRKGDVRILLGSTQKMGAGTNVQNKLIALHDLDVHWRPADVGQSEVVWRKALKTGLSQKILMQA